MNCHIRRLLLGVLTLVPLVTVGGEAAAQEKFPSRPIELVIPAPPGGGTDISMRVLAGIVEPVLGQKLVIVNRGGGAGVPAFVSVMNARPDGYTLGAWALGQLVIQPHTMAVPYTPGDFTTISLSSGSPVVFCPRADFPANSGKELIDLLRANPDKYTYGTDGPGSNIHIAGARIFSKVGVSIRPIPFSGAGETLKNFLGGHVDIYGGPISTVMPQVQAGAAKCLLVASVGRNPMLPQATDLGQLGIPDAETLIWRGVFGPKGMSSERVVFLEKVFADAARSEKFKEFLTKNGEFSLGLNAVDSKKRVDKDYSDIGEIVKILGLGKK